VGGGGGVFFFFFLVGSFSPDKKRREEKRDIFRSLVRFCTQEDERRMVSIEDFNKVQKDLLSFKQAQYESQEREVR